MHVDACIVIGVHEVNPYDGLAIEPLSEMLVTAAENLRLAIGPDRRGEVNITIYIHVQWQHFKLTVLCMLLYC